jgi:hypothetical protein
MGTNEEKGKIFKARWLILPSIMIWFLCILPAIMDHLSNIFSGIVFGFVGIGAVGVLVQKKSKSGKTYSFIWKWQDWVGLITCILVIYAIALKVDPITLIKLIADIFKNV